MREKFEVLLVLQFSFLGGRENHGMRQQFIGGAGVSKSLAGKNGK